MCTHMPILPRGVAPGPMIPAGRQVALMKPTHLILLSAASAVAVGHGFQVRFPAVAYRGPGTLRSDPASGAIRCGPSPRPSR